MRNSTEVPKILRRLVAAEGYLELGMPQHALEELESISNAQAGALRPAIEFYRGESLLAQKRYDDAIEPLKYAAETIPSPMNKQAWLSLGECFRQRGEEALAAVVEMFAADPPLGGLPEGEWDVSIDLFQSSDDDGDPLKYEYLASATASYETYADEEFGEGIIEEKNEQQESDDFVVENDDEDFYYDHDQFEN